MGWRSLQLITGLKLTRTLKCRAWAGREARHDTKCAVIRSRSHVVGADISESSKKVTVKGTNHIGTKRLKGPMAGEICMIGATKVCRRIGTAPRGIRGREKAKGSERSSCILIRGERSRGKVIRSPRGCRRTWFGAI